MWLSRRAYYPTLHRQSIKQLGPAAKMEAWALYLRSAQKGCGALYRAGDGSRSWYGVEHGPYREPSRVQPAATHTLLLPGSKESPVYTCCPGITVRSSYSYYQICLGLDRNLQHHPDHSTIRQKTLSCAFFPSQEIPSIGQKLPRARSVCYLSFPSGWPKNQLRADTLKLFAKWN